MPQNAPRRRKAGNKVLEDVADRYLAELAAAQAAQDRAQMEHWVPPPASGVSADQALLGFGAGFVPGAGIADVLGQLPGMTGEPMPSLAQNALEGRYVDAGTQFLSGLGDVAYLGSTVYPPLLAVGAALKAPRSGRLANALGDFPTTTIGRIRNRTKKGGYSVNLATGETPAPGLVMGKYRNTDPRNTVLGPGEKITDAAIVEFANKNRKTLTRKDEFFGTWQDPQTGKTYFDVSKWFKPDEIRKATKFGERTGQIAGYNVATGETFPVGNWEEFVRSEEFQDRMTEMAKVGRKYLSHHANKEWWDIHGSAFERVYGKENLEIVAGLTAATAPTRAPRENLQVMSEYMRRVIKGESVIQPDWRIPEGTMSRQAGKQIGNEKTSRANLEKAARGEWWNLRKEKVREEAAALLGDENAAVFDRHWARIAESPVRGIYTAVQEGVIPPGTAYGLLKDMVAEGARRANRPLRDFSADVWTGIRETIKTKSELFGQKYRGGAITGDSKSYADHFEDLIRQKAHHLGITQQEMERRLRAGDATLLSIMLATPLGAAIYEEYVGGGGA